MQIMDQFGAAPGAESVRMPDGTERTLAAEHAAAILVNEQPAFRVVCTPELLPQLALGRLLTEGWITSADEVERVAVCAQGLKISVQLRHPLAAAEQAGQEVPSCRRWFRCPSGRSPPHGGMRWLMPWGRAFRSTVPPMPCTAACCCVRAGSCTGARIWAATTRWTRPWAAP